MKSLDRLLSFFVDPTLIMWTRQFTNIKHTYNANLMLPALLRVCEDTIQEVLEIELQTKVKQKFVKILQSQRRSLLGQVLHI